MSKQTRRTFLKTTTAGALFSTFAISGTKASGRVIGANDTIRIGVAGINGRGQSHIKEFAGRDNVQVTYLIDPDSRLFESRSEQVSSRGGNTPKCVQDVREALDDKSLDAISIATCNHWHSLMTVWACQAKKNVYVEKPLSHNIYEGRKAVEAARKNDRIVQHGTQQRSSLARAKEIVAVQSGKYGKLLVSKGYCCKPRWSIGVQSPETPPAELDFNLWLGPAPTTSFHRNLVPYNWHWFWPTGDGDIGNQGVHEMDIARWAIKGAGMPNSVWSLGGRFGYKDQGQTPNTQLAVFDYGEALLLFEVRGLVEKGTGVPRIVANEYYTDEGMITQGKFYPKGSQEGQPLDDLGGSVHPDGPFGNFLNAVRSRNVDELNADVEKGHFSSALCHLANISYRLGEDARLGANERYSGGNAVVAGGLDALKNNLAKIGMKPEASVFQVGRKLKFDAKNEKFSGDPTANAMLTRRYREPFVVPETV